MNITLRPYQKDIIRQAAKKLATHKRVLVQAPTGSGKSYTFSSIIKRHLEDDPTNRVLVLTHREELFNQNNNSIEEITGRELTKLNAGMQVRRDHSISSCVISMIETLKRRDFDKLGTFSLVIVDEAHRNDFNEILVQLPAQTYLLGFTATPLSAKKSKPLNGNYNDIVSEVTIPELIAEGYLSKPVHYKAQFNQKGLRKQGKDYSSKTQMEKLSSAPVYENLVDLWRKHAEGKKTIVFNVNKKHTKEVDQQFKKHGIKSTHLLSGDKKRKAKLRAFENGALTVLNNCDILTMGFDVPSIECVILNRATASLPLYMQMVGRASRVTPTKDEFIILDFGGNIQRHGMWHLGRDWKDLFYNPPEKAIAPAPMKECPSCGALHFGGASECSECGHHFPTQKEKQKAKVVGYLKKVGKDDIIGKRIDDLSMDELVALEKSGKYKPSFGARVARTRGKQALTEYCELKGYNKRWIHYQQKMNKGYKNYRVKVG